jgi:hypothetical protein
MRTTSKQLKRFRKILAGLKPNQSLPKTVNLEDRQYIYYAAAGLGIGVRVLATPETKSLDLNLRRFEVERIR